MITTRSKSKEKVHIPTATMGKDKDNDKNSTENSGKNTASTKLIQEQLEKLNTAFAAMSTFVNTEIAKLNTLITQNVETQNNKILNLENRTAVLEKDLADQKLINKKLEKQVSELASKLDDNVSHSRRLNLILYDIPEENGEITSQVVKDFFVKEMNIPVETVDSFVYRDLHRLGLTENKDAPVIYRKKDKTGKQKFRAIIVAFLQQSQRNLVMSHAKNLKDSDYSIKPDLSPELAKLRNKLLQIRMEIKANDKTKFAQLTYHSYRPVLLIRLNGQTVRYNDTVNIEDCE